MNSIYESKVDPLRPNDAHGISLQLVGKSKTVLELGASSGHVTKALKALGNTVTVVERDARFLETLQSIADSVHITDLDWLDLREELNGQKFDVVLAGDVLEHCSQPDLVLLQLHDLLNPDGYVVISLPNIAHGDVRLSLLTGKFEYRDVGLLDRTHLRFFTRDSINDFLLRNSFIISEIFGSTANIGATEFGPPSSVIPAEVIKFVQEDRDALVYQFVVKAFPQKSTRVNAPPAVNSNTSKSKEQLLAQLCLFEEFVAKSTPANSTELAAIQNELATSETEKQQALTELATSETEKQQALTELKTVETKLLGMRDFVIGNGAELGELRFRHQKANAEVESLAYQINILHTSRTWRLGRLVMWPITALRRAVSFLRN